MSGIAGIVSREVESHLEPSYLSPMMEALGSSNVEDRSCVNIGSAALGAKGFQNQLAGVYKYELNGEHIVLALLGNIYNLARLSQNTNRNTGAIRKLSELYAREGISFLEKLHGEFAMALWDDRIETLYLATDRFRIAPLFYYYDDNKLVFSSRIKGILACPLYIDKSISSEAIVDFVGSSVIPTPKTIFKKIKKLPPGNVLAFSENKVSIETYWDINYLHYDEEPEDMLIPKLKKHFKDAVFSRLKADELPDRIGSFLSGGVDSSTLTGVLSKLSEHPVKSFSIGFDEQKYNEISYARNAARAFGIEHYEYFVSPRDTFEIIPTIINEFDEPYGNASAVPTFYCAKLAKEHGVDILYAGDGGDELFAGNERYADQKLFEYYYHIPDYLREKVVKPVVFKLSDILKVHFLAKSKKYILRASIPTHKRIASYGFYNIIPIKDIFNDAFIETLEMEYDPYSIYSLHYFNAQASTELDRQLYVDLKLSISDNDIFKVIRMTEAAGVSVHFPFLDHNLAEFSATIPAHIKMRGRNLRSFFKKAYSDILPSETISKTKQGFGLPIPVWLQTDKKLNEMMIDLVLSPMSVGRGYFQKRALEKFIGNHKTDITSFYGTVLWNLMILELWHQKNLT